MLAPLKHPWRKALLQSVGLYAICVAVLLWLLPPPVHFQFSSDRDGRLFEPTTEPALVRLASANKHPSSIQDYYIEHVDLNSGNTKRIPLNPSDSKLPGVQDYIHSRNGSLLFVLHSQGAGTASLWDGLIGTLRFVKSCEANRWEQIACSVDGSRIALITRNYQKPIEVFDAKTGEKLGHLTVTDDSKPRQIVRLQFSLEGKWLLCRFEYSDTPAHDTVTVLFDLTSNTAHHQTKSESFPFDEILPAPNGFWINHWDPVNHKLTLTYLDARTGQRTDLAPTLARLLVSFPHIFSDNAGHLYLVQTCKTDSDNWQHRTRKTLVGWLNKLGFDWETTDEIEIRHISPDGKRLISEQTFSANYAEISPDGEYLILMSQMKNDSRYVVYHYPTRLNWKHSLLWPLIPAIILAWIRYRTFRKTGLGATVSVLRNRV